MQWNLKKWNELDWYEKAEVEQVFKKVCGG